jgi:hypothetical protein
MTHKSRNIGAEILQGLREIKRGQIGRVVNVPDVARREKRPACPKPASPSCWAFRRERCRTGNRAGERRRGPPERSS